MKKAWQQEYDDFCKAEPVILKEDEQGWLFSEHIEQTEDILLKMKWSSNVPGSGAPEKVIIGAIADYEAMGYDVSQAEALILEGLRLHQENDMIGLNRITARIWHYLNTAPKIKDHPYWSFTVYDSLGKYLKKARFPEAIPVRIDAKYFQKTYYGWLAQICGGALGTAIEGYNTVKLQARFKEITGYIREPNTYNDDLTYEVAFLKALLRTGKKLTSADIAEEWVALIPFGWSAEEWALKNIKMGIYPPLSGYLHNPYREWIGAQMRGAICGMVAPGDPKKAAKLAFKDGVVSHYNNGVLGEIFNAVLTSLAYVQSDVHQLIKDSMAAIPIDSEFYSVIDFAYQSCLKHPTYQQAWQVCEEKFKRYNWVHAYPNIAAEIVALYYGKGDFDMTMNIISMVGYDVDCNAAQIATPLGIINGINTLGGKWTKPIKNPLKTYIRGHKELDLVDLTKETAKGAKLLK